MSTKTQKEDFAWSGSNGTKTNYELNRYHWKKHISMGRVMDSADRNNVESPDKETFRGYFYLDQDTTADAEVPAACCRINEMLQYSEK